MPARIRSRRAHSAFSRSRDRRRSGPLWVVRSDAPDDDTVAVAYAIGRRVGTAVVRNRLRRRLRALMRELEAAGEIAPGQYLVGADPAATTASFDELRDHLRATVGGRR